MRKVVVTTLTAAVLGAASLLVGVGTASAQMLPDGRYYDPRTGQAYTAQELDMMTTGSIMTVPQQIGPAPGQTWIGYCSAKYPTYNQTSNTYWGPDGQQYLCQ